MDRTSKMLNKKADCRIGRNDLISMAQTVYMHMNKKKKERNDLISSSYIWDGKARKTFQVSIINVNSLCEMSLSGSAVFKNEFFTSRIYPLN
jgi:hypothetical protein